MRVRGMRGVHLVLVRSGSLRERSLRTDALVTTDSTAFPAQFEDDAECEPVGDR
jgi:hypothetical protein